ncbi:MAG: DHH family phosphoesterase [Terracidiphilus sp.]
MSSLPQKAKDCAPAVSPQGASTQVPAFTTSDPLAAILEVLKQGERFLVCSHVRPDGDSLGSMLALGMVLQQMGKHADLVSANRIPLQYRHLPGSDSIHTASQVQGAYDAAVILECDSIKRTHLQGISELFLVNVDHHLTGQPFAHLNWIDYEAASVGEMVYRLVQAAGARITPEIAECLYTTVLTDTGGFCYGNVRASTFAMAREMVEAGADPTAIAHAIYFSSPISKLLLLGTALRRLKREGRIAWLWVTHQDMQRTCSTEEDCEGIVNVALSMAQVDAVVFLSELSDGGVRMSLRSKGDFDVAAIAERLGGGGHQNAAGCTLQGAIPQALKEVLTELRGTIAEWNPGPAHRSRLK